MLMTRSNLTASFLAQVRTALLLGPDGVSRLARHKNILPRRWDGRVCLTAHLWYKRPGPLLGPRSLLPPITLLSSLGTLGSSLGRLATKSRRSLPCGSPGLSLQRRGGDPLSLMLRNTVVHAWPGDLLFFPRPSFRRDAAHKGPKHACALVLFLQYHGGLVGSARI